MDACSHPVCLHHPLHLAIHSHPTLERLRFDNWRDVHNHLDPRSFPTSTKPRPRLAVERVTISSDPLFHSGLISVETLSARLPTYLQHLQIQLQTLEIHTPHFDASVYARLVGVSIPDLRTLRLAINGPWWTNPVGVDVYHTGSWRLDGLSGFPSITSLELIVARSPTTILFHLPRKALARVPGLEGFSHSSLESSFEKARPGELILALLPRDAQNRRELVGLRFGDCYGYVNFSSDDFSTMDNVFPSLRSLELDSTVGLEGVRLLKSTRFLRLHG